MGFNTWVTPLPERRAFSQGLPGALQGSLPLTVAFPRNGLTLRPTVQSDSMYFNSFFLSCMTSPRFWKSLSSPPRPTPPHQPRYRAAFTAKYKVNSTHHHSHSAATAKGSVPSAVPGLEDAGPHGSAVYRLWIRASHTLSRQPQVVHRHT